MVQRVEKRFRYGGEPFTAHDGDSIASAMVRNAHLVCRRNDSGDGRGIFCGMGVCNECVVEVDGTAGVLSCMTALKDGMEITVQEQHRDAPQFGDSGAPLQLPEEEVSCDLVIIGGGPAGLSLAKELARLSPTTSIVIIDERKSLGGQYFKQRQVDQSNLTSDAQFEEGAALIEEVRQSGVRILNGVTVWAVFDPDHLLGYDGERRYKFTPKELVIATGAYERGIPMPGWTLPGVMTTGAAQTLLRSYSISLGNRVLIAGNGPLNLQMAAELVRHGTDVVALVESGRIFSIGSIARTILLGLISPSMALRGLGYMVTIKRARVPFFSGAALSSFGGSESVERTTITSLASMEKIKSVEVDAVAMGYGFIPSNEVARNLGAEHVIDPATRGLKTKTALDGATSREHLWVIGDGRNINGAQVAKLRGQLLATSLAGIFTGKRRTLRALAQRVLLARQLLFQEVLWRIYKSPMILDQFTTKETTICRCLSITKGEILDDLTSDMVTAGALKRVNRVGMGKCQGRYCSPFAQKIIEDATGLPSDALSGFAPQVPIKPTSIANIAYPMK
jgi:thioredoxin reductase